MAAIGQFSLILALIISISSSFFPRRAQIGICLTFLLSSFSIGLLIFSFISRNFGLLYVAEYSSRDLPWYYTFSALWAGSAGSLLFWQWLLAFYSLVAIWQTSRQNRQLLPYVISILMVISSFFLCLLVFYNPPFNKLAVIPSDGYGLDPILQNLGMLFHPPALYLGFVGFSVPFALALGALISGNLDNSWLKLARPWILFSWLWLGAGNLLGAQWAYTELGWGGYWGWDPVENVSLIPWLLGTALLHSAILYGRHGRFKAWTIILTILTFLTVIFGTFLTRSGIINSVHAFSFSGATQFFLIFLLLSIIFPLYFWVMRYSQLRDQNSEGPLISPEATFLYNNLILCGLVLVIFLGTIFPLITKIFFQTEMLPNLNYYNRMCLPFAIALIILMLICTLVSKFEIRKIGSYLAHLGVILIFVALLGNIAKTEKNVSLLEGQAFSLGDYVLKYEKSLVDENRFAISTEVGVYKNGQIITVLCPEKLFYPRTNKSRAKVAIYSCLKEDLYLVLDRYNRSGLALFKARINPLVEWLWIGGFLLSVGTLLALLKKSW